MLCWWNACWSLCNIFNKHYIYGYSSSSSRLCVLLSVSLLHAGQRKRRKRRRILQEDLLFLNVLQLLVYPHYRRSFGPDTWLVLLRRTYAANIKAARWGKKNPARHIFQRWTPLTTLWCSLWVSSFFFLPPQRNYGCNSLRRKHVRLRPASGFLS